MNRKKRFYITILSIILIFAMFILMGCNQSSSENYGGENSNVDGSGNGSAGDNSSSSDTSLESKTPLIVYNVSFYIKSDDILQTSKEIENVVSEYGYVSNQKENNSYCSITLKIETSKLDDFTKLIKDNYDITNYTLSATDVSTKYYDKSALLESYKISLKMYEDMLKDMQNGTTDTSNWNYIDNQLQYYRKLVLQLEQELSGLENQINYSTIEISINSIYVPEEEIGFGQKIKNAFSGTGSALSKFFQFLLIALIYVVPFALFFGLILLVVLLIRKKIKAKKMLSQTENSNNQSHTGIYSNLNNMNNYNYNNDNNYVNYNTENLSTPNSDEDSLQNNNNNNLSNQDSNMSDK